MKFSNERSCRREGDCPQLRGECPHELPQIGAASTVAIIGGKCYNMRQHRQGDFEPLTDGLPAEERRIPKRYTGRAEVAAGFSTWEGRACRVRNGRAQIPVAPPSRERELRGVRKLTRASVRESAYDAL